MNVDGFLYDLNSCKVGGLSFSRTKVPNCKDVNEQSLILGFNESGDLVITFIFSYNRLFAQAMRILGDIPFRTIRDLVDRINMYFIRKEHEREREKEEW